MIGTSVVVDLNVRVENGVTFCGYEDVRGPFPRVGDMVYAHEVEDDIVAEAIVTRLDEERQIIYLAVAWNQFRDNPPPTPDEFMRAYQAAQSSNWGRK